MIIQIKSSEGRALGPARAGIALLSLMTVIAAGVFIGCAKEKISPELPASSDLAEGQRIFRFDTFGDEEYWTDTARLHEIVEEHLSPLKALKLGLKVDLDKLSLLKFVSHNPFGTSGTKELLRENAVVGVQATFNEEGDIARIGITCAFCHSTVDNALVHGIGHRLDGYPNRDLNVGAIIALSPAISEDQKVVYESWGPGKYDPRFNVDGKNTPLVIPPAYGLAQIENETYTAEGPISYWNAYVAVTQMHGHGNFSDPRLGIDIKHTPDMVGPKLAALRLYQHSLAAPLPPDTSFDVTAAARGSAIFGQTCLDCHVGGNGTDNNSGKLHAPSETGVDGTYAARTANKGYRTTPLRGLWQHPPYFHDGSAATLTDVVAQYNRVRTLGLTTKQQEDLVEYLKSL